MPTQTDVSSRNDLRPQLRGGRTGNDDIRNLSRLHHSRQVDVDDRRQTERDELRHQETADDGQTERPARLAAGAVPECNWQRPEERRRRGHHDRPEADDAALVDGVDWRLAVRALLLEREV